MLEFLAHLQVQVQVQVQKQVQVQVSRLKKQQPVNI